ncbi:hypothetical protein [Spirosoma areae]
MISIKEAAQRAADFCQQLFPDAQNILLEEVERDEDNKFWLITVSYLATATKRAGVTIPGMEIDTTVGQLFTRFERHYKSLKVDAQTVMLFL